MEFVKNMQPGVVLKLENMIEVRRGEIVSMALSSVDNAQIVLFALSAGELISEEAYFGDTMYQVLSGKVALESGGTRHQLSAGDAMAFSAHQGHALYVVDDSKLLQIILNK